MSNPEWWKKCSSCGYCGGGWKYEGRQHFVKMVGGKAVRSGYDLYTCPSCGSTLSFEPKKGEI